MTTLEHRIPPPFVAVLVAVGMGLLAALGPATEIDRLTRLSVVMAFALAAAAFAALGIRAFGRARTTVNPVDIDNASTLVTTGVYGWTRNPMYVGLTLLLCAWGVYLAMPWVVAGPIVFVAYITRFQIVPEERALQRRFGLTYEQYRRRVRRWL